MHLATALLAFAVSLCRAGPTLSVTSGVFSDLRLFAEYSAVAYCTASYLKSSNAPLVCSSAVCPRIDNATTEIVASFDATDSQNTTGIIMLDHARQLKIISFRGTHTLNDAFTDLNFLLEDADDICPGCEIHSGFLESWRGVSSYIVENFVSLQMDYSNYTTVITGHSLGGALANLCAAGLKKISPTAQMSLLTYGSPRVGNPTFANYINKLFGWNNYRVTHLNDAVPWLPPKILGFAHASPEYHITAPRFPGVLHANSSTLMTPKNLVVTQSDITVIPGPESTKGNIGYSCSDVAMHFEYLGPISGCISSNLTPENLQNEGEFP